LQLNASGLAETLLYYSEVPKVCIVHKV